MQQPVIRRRHSVRFEKSTVKAGIVVKSAMQTSFADGNATLDLCADCGEAFLRQILINAHAGALLEQVRDIGLAEIKRPGNFRYGQLLVPMGCSERM